ncbi:flagellar biosynthesis anti-sigma factor FlgM [Crenobacter caeni]|uniref:Negative regulator of flagellin synthesis n=1 Tax=Crenobacter caeni TaxID=2705474 RepID=A0A6B2KS75_9NEIS|nr:flagellar biosynthesis anti-sigma factor FlgM [Crenobacter caeni]NDV12787.1 flagellar biosynthesis anti-sigma factor FlgM [Crenobacter caeni]
MQINPQLRATHAQTTATRPAQAKSAQGTPAAVSAASAQTPEGARLARAREALREAPEVDLERVEAVRAAIARGEVRFDAERLAGLIEQFHGVRT